MGAIISHVKYVMEQHGESRFTPWDAEKGSHTVNRAGFDKRLVIQVLREHGYIIPGSDGKTMSTHKPPALSKPIKLYRFSPSILADEDA